MHLATVEKQTLQKKSAKKLTLRRMSLVSRPQSTLPTVILADISGSMSGEPLNELKKALTKVWSPSVECIGFGTDTFWITFDDITHLHTSGSTNLLQALRDGWSLEKSRMILMTDGQPDQATSTILEAVSLHPTPPIDTIGLGSHCNNDLLKEISRLTNGRFTDIDDPQLLAQTFQFLLDLPKSSQSTSTSTTGAIQL